LCKGDLCVSLGDFLTPLGEIFRGVLGEICRVDMPDFLGDRLGNLDQALVEKITVKGPCGVMLSAGGVPMLASSGTCVYWKS
jgi:hypothetical protein